jgi:integrase
MRPVKKSKKEFPKTITEAGVSAKIYRREKVKNGRSYTEYVLTYSEAGKRAMRYFADADEATTEARLAVAKIASGQAAALHLTGTEREEYLLARGETKRLGMPLLSSVREYAAALDKLAGKAGLLEAVDYFVNHFDANLPERTVEEAIAEMLTAKERDGASELYLRDLRIRLATFSGAFGKSQIRFVRHAQLNTWLRGLDLAPRTRNNFKNCVGSLFSFAKAAGYLPRDRSTEAEGLVKAKVKDGEIEIFTPAEIRRILNRMTPELLPFVAIGAFAGVRSEEIMRLDWKDIDFEQRHVLVGADKAKTASRRLVPITDNLFAWLAPYQNATGPVCRWKKTQVMAQKLAEANRKTNDGSGAVEKGVEWKKNGLRHSFASYRLAATQNAPQVALECGNSARMLFAHYRALATSVQAAEWFGIMPGPSSANVIQLVQSA